MLPTDALRSSRYADKTIVNVQVQTQVIVPQRVIHCFTLTELAQLGTLFLFMRLNGLYIYPWFSRPTALHWTLPIARNKITLPTGTYLFHTAQIFCVSKVLRPKVSRYHRWNSLMWTKTIINAQFSNNDLYKMNVF